MLLKIGLVIIIILFKKYIYYHLNYILDFRNLKIILLNNKIKFHI